MQFGLAGRWNTCTKIVGATQLRSCFGQLFAECITSVSIGIVADYVALPCQVTRKLKRATTLISTTTPAIIFIHCCAFVLYFQLFIFSFINFESFSAPISDKWSAS